MWGRVVRCHCISFLNSHTWSAVVNSVWSRDGQCHSHSDTILSSLDKALDYRPLGKCKIMARSFWIHFNPQRIFFFLVSSVKWWLFFKSIQTTFLWAKPNFILKLYWIQGFPTVTWAIHRPKMSNWGAHTMVETSRTSLLRAICPTLGLSHPGVASSFNWSSWKALFYFNS